MPRLLLLFVWVGAFFAGTLAMRAADETAARATLVKAITATGDDQQKALDELSNTDLNVVRDTLKAWTRGGISLYKSADGTKTPVLLEDHKDADGKARAIRIDTGKPVADDKGADAMFGPKDLEAISSEPGTLSSVQGALDMLALTDPSADVRQEAIQKMGKSQKMELVPVLQGRLDKESSGRVKKAIRIAVATLQLNDDTDPQKQIAATQELGKLNAIGALDDLKALADDPDCKSEVIKASKVAIASIESYQKVVNFFGTVFHGLSAGSILLVVALGLAITFGLMGIINMAHGEMLAIGGYTSYVVQCVFAAGFYSHVKLPLIGGFNIAIPGLHAEQGSALFESYFLFVIPLSFITSACAGLILERTVIRFLYSRPLESLLATWGVSLIMQQCFRLVFGANNVQIQSPHWLSSNWTVFDITFGYNRLFVIVFAVLIVIGTWALLTKTPLGLLIRAVMQNRDMAACMGVPTARVNMLTFAFGSGLAGLAGAFLSQITNVGPSMGQASIVDSFMTVVVGGVGNIIGCIYAALGIGTADQVLQQTTGSPVSGKITALIAIILFLQWKPGGMFPSRSRSLEG